MKSSGGAIAGSVEGLKLFGHISGSGTIAGSSIFGNVDVGNSVGHLTLTDVVIGSDNAAVTVEIGGTESSLHDTITITGDTMLAGDLNIEFINEFTPQADDVFDILDFNSANLSSLFGEVNLPALASDLEWDQSSLYTTGELLVSLSQIAGDFDSGGDVDGDDFLLWQRNFPYPTAISSVPEPNSLALLAIGGLLMLRRQRRTQTRSANLRITRGLEPATNRPFSIS